MPKIAASIVFPVCGHPLRNAVVELDNSGFVLSVSSGGANFRELAGVEFYSGILIPGLVDVLSGPGDNLYSLIASGVRVAGRIGNSGERRGVSGSVVAGSGVAGSGKEGSGVAGSGNAGSGKEGSGKEGSGKEGSGKEGSGKEGSGNAGSGVAGSATELNEDYRADPVAKSPGKQATGGFVREARNGRSLGYRIYKDAYHFGKLFRESGIEGMFLFDGPGGESRVLAGTGGNGLWGTIQRLHEGNYGFNLLEILEMATLNGALATGYNYEAGCISEGLNPGLNIIEGIDPSGMKLLPVSRLRRLK